MDFPCGGQRKCGQCKVHIDPPPSTGIGANRPLPPEEIARGLRLACEAVIEAACTVTIPEGRETGTVWQDATSVGQTRIQAGEAVINRHSFKVPPPSLTDQRSDWERVRTVLNDNGFHSDYPDYSSLEDLSENLRSSDWNIHVLMEGESFVCSCRSSSDRFYGFAVDLGTTTVDVSLHNLESGRRIARKTLLNRQTAYGADVISRAQAFAGDRRAVRGAALDTIQEAATMILEETGISADSVVRSVVVGNPIMIHILHDLNPLQLALAPYINVVSDMVRRKPVEFGWTFQKHGFVESLPLISAFVGADTTGMIVALDLADGDGTTVFIDIGTNGELVLAHNGKLYTTSAAAGPAFEGAQIACGTRAVPGAICDVTVKGSTVAYEVLGGETPNGICGTGLIKTVAQLLDAGVIDDTGRMVDPAELKYEALRGRIFNMNGMSSFALTEDKRIYITQKDIRELQLAKGAIRTALDSLLDEVGVGWQDIDRISLAGNFGAGMSGEAGIRIGLFPEIDLEKVDAVGNAALRGAALALVSRTHRRKAAQVPGICSFLELAGKPEFQMRFAESMMF